MVGVVSVVALELSERPKDWEVHPETKTQTHNSWVAGLKSGEADMEKSSLKTEETNRRKTKNTRILHFWGYWLAYLVNHTHKRKIKPLEMPSMIGS